MYDIWSTDQRTILSEERNVIIIGSILPHVLTITYSETANVDGGAASEFQKPHHPHGMA